MMAVNDLISTRHDARLARNRPLPPYDDKLATTLVGQEGSLAKLAP
jgi:hypothetical protein